jgi:hypothetical protein
VEAVETISIRRDRLNETELMAILKVFGGIRACLLL